jgi:hypothetical protein
LLFEIFRERQVTGKMSRTGQQSDRKEGAGFGRETGDAGGGSRLRARSAAPDLEHLNARIPSEVMTKLRVHCALNRVSIQNVVTDAVGRFLQEI